MFAEVLKTPLRALIVIVIEETMDTQSAFTCSKVAIETLEEGVKYVHS